MDKTITIEYDREFSGFHSLRVNPASIIRLFLLEYTDEVFRIVFFAYDGSEMNLTLFKRDFIGWYDINRNHSTDYTKLLNTLAIYSEKARLERAIDSLD